MQKLTTLAACAALLTATGTQAQDMKTGPLTTAAMCLVSEEMAQLESAPEGVLEIQRYSQALVWDISRQLENPAIYHEYMTQRAEDFSDDEPYKLSLKRQAKCLEPLLGQ